MLLFHTENLPHYGLERIFEFTKKAGFDGIEIGITHLLDTQSPAYLKKLEERYKIPIIAFSMSEKNDQALTKAFQLTVREFPKSTIILNPPPSMGGHYKNWLEKTIPKLATKYHLITTRKNLPPKSMMGFIPERSENTFMHLRKAPRICLDTSALIMAGEDLMQATSLILNKIYHVHLSNSTQKSRYTPPHQGYIPIESFLTKLARNNFEGNISARVKPAFFEEGNEEKVLEEMIKIKKFYEKYFVQEQTIH